MTVHVDDVGAATVVTMAWTAKRNALGPAEADVLTDALRAAGERRGSVVVLTGEGAFCAGGDLPAIIELTATMTPRQVRDTVYSRFQGVIRVLRNCPVPTIAAVDGPAIGLGLDLALACDMRFAGPAGWLRQGWARAGLIPGTGGVGLLHRVAPSTLWHLLSTQDKLDADECARLGIAERAVASARSAALNRAETLAVIPRDVLGHYAALERTASWPSLGQFEESARLQADLLCSDRFRSFAAELLGRPGSS
jgi:enoyl-CoA hydratase/carnithine racemase